METYLDSSAEEGKLILNRYSFIRQNRTQDSKRGGVGLYIKADFHEANSWQSDCVHAP